MYNLKMKEFKPRSCFNSEAPTLNSRLNNLLRMCSEAGTKPLLMTAIVLLSLNLVSCWIPVQSAPGAFMAKRRRLTQRINIKVPSRDASYPNNRRGFRNIKKDMKLLDLQINELKAWKSDIQKEMLTNSCYLEEYPLAEDGKVTPDRKAAHFRKGIEDAFDGIKTKIDDKVKDLIIDLCEKFDLGLSLHNMKKYNFGGNIVKILISNISMVLNQNPDTMNKIIGEVMDNLVKGSGGILAYAAGCQEFSIGEIAREAVHHVACKPDNFFKRAAFHTLALPVKVLIRLVPDRYVYKGLRSNFVANKMEDKLKKFVDSKMKQVYTAIKNAEENVEDYLSTYEPTPLVMPDQPRPKPRRDESRVEDSQQTVRAVRASYFKRTLGALAYAGKTTIQGGDMLLTGAAYVVGGLAMGSARAVGGMANMSHAAYMAAKKLVTGQHPEWCPDCANERVVETGDEKWKWECGLCGKMWTH